MIAGSAESLAHEIINPVDIFICVLIGFIVKPIMRSRSICTYIVFYPVFFIGSNTSVITNNAVSNVFKGRAGVFYFQGCFGEMFLFRREHHLHFHVFCLSSNAHVAGSVNSIFNIIRSSRGSCFIKI